MKAVSESAQEYGRGIAGGLLVSLPLLYTMEVWWAGFSVDAAHLLLGLAVTFVMLLGYNRFAGLHHDASFAEVAIDSVEELGIGLVVSGAVLWMIGRIDSGTPAREALGKIVVEGLTVAIGVSIGTAQLGGEAGGFAGDRDDRDDAGTRSLHGEMLLAMCGAVLVAANVAPTDEVAMIAQEIGGGRVLAIAVVSLAFGALVHWFTDFAGAGSFAPHATGNAHKVASVVLGYSIALLASAAMLLFFGRFDGTGWWMCLAQTIVLGFAANFGASAGRFLLRR